MNIFATVLTYPAPSANYRGESEENRSVIQRVTYGRFEYPIISPEAMRNALREILTTYSLPNNRKRLHNEDQLAVCFEDYPYPDKYADDFFFGYLVASRGQVPEEIVKNRNFQFKRDSVLRMNLALALEPYRHDALFTQSPLTVKNKRSPWQNSTKSALLHRETVVTAYQYPFAINLNDCRIKDNGDTVDHATDQKNKSYSTIGEQRKDWLRFLFKAISELNGVAGNHARSYYEMAPASVMIRVTHSLVAGYETYGFKPDGSFPEVIDGILEDDYPGKEFYMGGQIVKKNLTEETKKKLKEKGVKLYRMANEALSAVMKKTCDSGFQAAEREWKEKENSDALSSR